MVFEYLMNVDSFQRKRHPGWVEEKGHFRSPVDGSFIGWSPDSGSRDYYVPDSVIVFTKEELVQRQLTIHASYPMMKPDPDNPGPGLPEENMIAMTDAEVRAEVEAWYDSVEGA